MEDERDRLQREIERFTELPAALQRYGLDADDRAALLREDIVPAVTVPVSLFATFVVASVLGFTINLLTLLALVLAIGLVVDDAIVVREDIHRLMHTYGETGLVAAFRGSRQIAFAVVATTMALVAVFVPIDERRGFPCNNQSVSLAGRHCKQ